jgi:hypothetical protein
MRRWVLLVPALCFAVVGMASPAAAAAPVVTTYTEIADAPQHVAVGGTLSFTMTVVEQSTYDVRLIGMKFQIHNACDCGSDHTNDTTATFLDPRTGSWHGASLASGGTYFLQFRSGDEIKPGQQLSIPVRVVLGSLPSGSYVLAGSGGIIGYAADSRGHFVNVSWAHHDAADHTFSLGTVAAALAPSPPASTSSTSPTPSATKTATGHKASTTTKPAVTATPSVDPTGAPASTAAAPSAVSAAAPMSTTEALSDTASTISEPGFSSALWLLVPTGILVGFVFWRYRKPSQRG